MHSPSQEKRSYEHSRDDEAQLPVYQSASDDEASLPLYNSPQDATKPPLPDKTATPPEVREFVTQLLIITRSLTETHAREIASKWTLGSGEDLLDTYPPQMYRDLFGSEEGWAVFKEVMLHKYETSHPEKGQRQAGCIAFVISSLIMTGVVLLGRLALRKRADLWLTALIIIGLFDAIVVLVGFVMAVAPKTTPLKLVEGKLKDSFFKAPQSGSSN